MRSSSERVSDALEGCIWVESISPSRIEVAFIEEGQIGACSHWIGSATSAMVDAMYENRGLFHLE